MIIQIIQDLRAAVGYLNLESQVNCNTCLLVYFLYFQHFNSWVYEQRATNVFTYYFTHIILVFIPHWPSILAFFVVLFNFIVKYL